MANLWVFVPLTKELGDSSQKELDNGNSTKDYGPLRPDHLVNASKESILPRSLVPPMGLYLQNSLLSWALPSLSMGLLLLCALLPQSLY
ncbi:hypothetical protein PHJA_000832800 [Phtheirospermum japonicum]|uniref:Uncharacterized protein n=1 Tax=Phtheirospermum japonicum TaxID=374723 RepID=A0A830BH39_9LAMI|nr:hypothetical protein PHJA_000832800 [Phtheirospermum japonicum]